MDAASRLKWIGKSELQQRLARGAWQPVVIMIIIPVMFEPIAIWAAICLAIVLSAVAVARAYVPPQRREIFELRSRVDELEHEVVDLERRVTVRARREGMATARANHEERAARRDAIEAQAAEIVAAAARPAQQVVPQRPPTKAELRALYLTKGVTRQ